MSAAAVGAVGLWAARSAVHKSTGRPPSGVRRRMGWRARRAGCHRARSGPDSAGLKDSEPAIGVGVHPHLDLDEEVPVALRWDLQAKAVVAHAVVIADGPLLLHTQDLGEVARE